MCRRRQKLQIGGVVQGVGFRPFVYRLAQECGISGFVRNSSDGVTVEAEGQIQNLEAFRRRVCEEAPPLAQISSLESAWIQTTGDNQFLIRASRRHSFSSTSIPPDVAVCDDCLRELFDSQDRRFNYPFINCTNCGPRFTIVRGIPYDRPETSMSEFTLCEECAREYHTPENRRFHAQPNACPRCGPQVRLHGSAGDDLASENPIGDAIQVLREGQILALRGIGGFHLVVDATNDTAVCRLRLRKGREERPLALMAPDLETVGKFCHVSTEEALQLSSPARPIVLLRVHTRDGIGPSVAPDNPCLGFMLPYSPLHHLILRNNFEALVMTSGNYTEEPIATGNDEALERLSPIADYFLLHNREILQRCDDSVVRVVGGEPRIIRRARGFVPSPINLGEPTRQVVLACGAELKNTVGFSRGKDVFLSQHIGDLDSPKALEFFEDSIAHLSKILEIKPDLIAHDLHPEYLSTKWATAQNNLPRVGVQHHHAHLASLLADNHTLEPAIGIILDGTGYGEDGTIWGGEVLVGDASGFQRYAWLEPIPLPGGEAAIRQPWRTALSALYAAYADDLEQLDFPLLKSIPDKQVEVVLKMVKQGLNCPLTSSCGRLFDAVSALLGIRRQVNYEAQAAIELEHAVDETEKGLYQDAIGELRPSGGLSSSALIRAICEDIQQNTPVSTVAARFHWTLAEFFIQASMAARDSCDLNRVGLSGGVFQNAVFFSYCLQRLREEGFEVLTHSRVPTNDGGIALGQIVVADALLRNHMTEPEEGEIECV